MVYRDDPTSLDHDDDGSGSHDGSSRSGGESGSFEIDDSVEKYRDDPSSSSHDDDLERPPTAASGSARIKPMLGMCLLAALAVGGYKFSTGGNGNSTTTSVSDAPTKPLFTGSKTGVRGKSNNNSQETEEANNDGCVDDSLGLHRSNGLTCETYLEDAFEQPGLLADRCATRTEDMKFLVKDLCRLSCGACGEDSDADDSITEQQTIADESPPPTSGEACEDDASFVHSTGKKCAAFKEVADKPPEVKTKLCMARTNRKGENGQQLLVKDFCRQSCGVCDDMSNVVSTPLNIEEEKEFEEELEEDLAEIEEEEEICRDDPTFVHASGKMCTAFGKFEGKPAVVAKLCARGTGMKGNNGQELLVQDFCRVSCGVCDEVNNVPSTLTIAQEDEVEEEIEEDLEEIEEEAEANDKKPAVVPVPVAKPARPKHTTSLPKQSDECEDDDTYIHTNLKTCPSFVEHVGRPALHESRCNQVTGIMDADGKELLLMHFCKKSCGLCNNNK